MDQKEVVKDIVVTALQERYISRSSDSKANAEAIAEFYKTIYNAILNPKD